MFTDKLNSRDQPIIVAEIAQNHDGSLGMCHAFVDALADAGAHAIKFQTHIAREESTTDDAFRVKFSRQDASRFDYWRRMEFTTEQWSGLKAHADDRGIHFLSTPFSMAAFELLEKLGVPAWKIGSGDTSSQELLHAMLATGKPIIVSTGMSDWAEIHTLAATLRDHNNAFALMQCTSMYPTPLAYVGLNVLDELSLRFGCRTGLSDHSGSLAPAMTAIARGHNIVELHATFDRRSFGPDVSSSVTIDEIEQLVRYADAVATMNANPVDKDEMAARLLSQKQLFGRSVSLSAPRPAGHVLRPHDLAPKKPGTGIPWSERESVVGRRLARDVSDSTLLRREDLV